MTDRETPLPAHLRFAAAPTRSHPGTIATLLRHPRATWGIVSARLLGRRLRARQRLAALAGIDHRLWLPADARPASEPQAAIAAAGIAVTTPGRRAGAIEGDAAVVLLLPQSHVLVAGAANAIATAFRKDPALQALYGDALVVRDDGALLPILRPAFDRAFFGALDVLGPVVALRRDSLAAIAKDLASGAEALDLLLRIEAADGRIRHLPRILSLSAWSAAGEADSDSRLAAIRADRSRRGEGGTVTIADGAVSVARPLPEPRPCVSLIVPTRDRLDLLRPCIESLLTHTDWPAREILICDNDSREPGTLAYFRDCEARGLARVIPCPGPFDFAGMNNRAAEAARGDVLAFVNNDVEAFRPDWLERMVREALRPEVGAVGAKLLDGKGRIQHGGVVLGTGGGLVTHGHRHFAGDAPGYLGALSVTHRVSAVTAACLVVEAQKFRAVGGFDAERFAVDFNDVDLCLRLDAAGWRTLLVPSAVLHHREAASRVRSPEAEARHRREVANLQTRWGSLLAQDPHYHPGFDPDLATHARLRRGWTGLEPVEPR